MRGRKRNGKVIEGGLGRDGVSPKTRLRAVFSWEEEKLSGLAE